MIKLDPNRRNEYPIVYFWYTKHKGKTIEELIDKDVYFFEWVVSTFQNVTPSQAQHYFNKTGKKLPDIVIEDVEPYEHQPSDPELTMYEEICETRDLKAIIKKYRGEQLNLF